MTLLITDPRFLQHDTGPHHVETADRLRSIEARLHERGLIERCTTLPIEQITDAEVKRIHDQGMIALLRRIADAGGGRADPDTVVNTESPTVTRLAAGACCAA